MSRKTVVEEAVIQMKNLEDALKENAKGILASTMRQEIKSLVKESLKEQDEVDTDDEEEVDIVSPEEEEDVNVDDEETFDVEDDEMDDEDDDMDVEDDDMDDEDEDMGDEDEDMGVNMGLDVDDEDETIDMRGASDEDVAVVFSKMGKNDKVSIEKIGDYYDLKDTENDTEYIIKLNESDEDEFGSMMGSRFDDEDRFGPMMSSRFDDEEDDRFSSMKGGRFDDEDRFGSMMSSRFNDEEDDEEYGFRSMKGGRFDDEDRFGSMMSSNFDDEEEEDGFGSMKGGRFGREPEETIYELEIGEEMEGDVGLGEELDEMSMDEDMSYEDLGETYMDEDMTYEDLDEMFVEEDSWSSMSDDTSKFKVHESKQKTGSASKFKYSKKPNQEGGFNTKMKEGSKRYGKSGKANFDYDNEDPNSEIVMKIVNKITKGKKIETKEASRTLANNRKVKRNLMASPSQLKEEVEVLREKNDEYRKALDLFRTKLNEVAVFNSNLAYATRLFTEHSTTKPEKINILRRFDNVESLKESKNLYQILKNELSNNNLSDNSINESFNRTVTKSPSTGSSVNLIESKTYENPQFLRMKDLMGKIK
jgi:hypothetical protein